MDSMFDTLMTLPLFRGVSQERMAETVGKAKFHFLKYLPNTTFIDAGERCTYLKFMLGGSARITTANADGRFKVAQTLTAPEVICPDFLFGIATSYPCSATAIDMVNILQVDKSDYLNILSSDPIFLINYLNYLATNAQKTIDGVMSITMGDVETRLALWVLCLTQARATDIVFTARTRDLCSVFGMQRSSFNAAMSDLADRGFITFNGQEIRVTSRHAMAELLNAPQYV